jgi:hypothetical protein
VALGSQGVGSDRFTGSGPCWSWSASLARSRPSAWSGFRSACGELLGATGFRQSTGAQVVEDGSGELPGIAIEVIRGACLTPGGRGQVTGSQINLQRPKTIR